MLHRRFHVTLDCVGESAAAGIRDAGPGRSGSGVKVPAVGSSSGQNRRSYGGHLAGSDSRKDLLPARRNRQCRGAVQLDGTGAREPGREADLLFASQNRLSQHRGWRELLQYRQSVRPHIPTTWFYDGRSNVRRGKMGHLPVRGDRGLSRCLGPRPKTRSRSHSMPVRSRAPTPALTTPRRTFCTS